MRYMKTIVQMYPHITERITIGWSHEGRDIIVMKVRIDTVFHNYSLCVPNAFRSGQIVDTRREESGWTEESMPENGLLLTWPYISFIRLGSTVAQ